MEKKRLRNAGHELRNKHEFIYNALSGNLTQRLFKIKTIVLFKQIFLIGDKIIFEVTLDLFKSCTKKTSWKMEFLLSCLLFV